MNRPVALPLVAVFLVGLAYPPCAEARNRVARMYRGKVVLLKKRPPPKFSSDGSFVRFLKANRRKDIWPADKKETRWKVEFFAFFKRKHTDVEVKIKFFDVTEGKRFIAGDSIFLAQRGQPILSSNIVLEKPRFRVNRKYAMYITDAHNNMLASATFWLRGKREVYSGRVNFSDDEARLTD